MRQINVKKKLELKQEEEKNANQVILKYFLYFL